jgi:hypothetical protein
MDSQQINFQRFIPAATRASGSVQSRETLMTQSDPDKEMKLSPFYASKLRMPPQSRQWCRRVV